MGTYTTNYNLFMPTVGEQGWGTLVNGNFVTIDTTMDNFNTRLTAVESEVNGALSCTSVTTSGKVTANGGIGTTSLTTSGTITSTGLITANGGIKGTLTGNVNGGTISGTTGTFSGTITGASFNGVPIKKVYNVTSATPTGSEFGDTQTKYCVILPIACYKYTGSIQIKNIGSYTITIEYRTSLNGDYNSISILKNNNATITLNNADCLFIYASSSSAISVGNITLS